MKRFIFLLVFLFPTFSFTQIDTVEAEKFVVKLFSKMKKGEDVKSSVSADFWKLNPEMVDLEVARYSFDEIELGEFSSVQESIVLSNDGRRNTTSIEYYSCPVQMLLDGELVLGIELKIQDLKGGYAIFPDNKSYSTILLGWHTEQWVDDVNQNSESLVLGEKATVVMQFLYDLINKSSEDVLANYFDADELIKNGRTIENFRIDGYSYDYFSIVDVSRTIVTAQIGYFGGAPKTLLFSVQKKEDKHFLKPGRINRVMGLSFVNGWIEEVGKDFPRRSFVHYKNVNAILADTNIYGVYEVNHLGIARLNLHLKPDMTFTYEISKGEESLKFDGTFKVKSNQIQLVSISNPKELEVVGDTLVIVRWGKRIYLLQENKSEYLRVNSGNDFIEFADSWEYNRKRHKMNLKYFIKENHAVIPVEGMPDFPEEWRYLLGE